ncbi:MAG: Holliday junction resolvase RuvX [Candidatus Margulisiibacteriota bacterium]
MILAIDPGRDKCGLAVLDDSAVALEKKVIKRAETEAEVLAFIAKYRIETIVIGGGTEARGIEKLLLKLDLRLNIIFTKEDFSTLEARKKYWQENPPKGLLKLVPRSLLSPPVPIDDYAAVILGERYLKG